MKKKEAKRETVHEKLQILSSLTKSHAINEASIVLDATNYIKNLKHKIEELTEDIATAESSSHHNLWPQVSVETLEKGLLVNVYSGQACPGLLVSMLETFEDLGLVVIEATVSCVDSFHLQALGGNNEDDEEAIDAKVVKRAISSTIKNWRNFK